MKDFELCIFLYEQIVCILNQRVDRMEINHRNGLDNGTIQFDISNRRCCVYVCIYKPNENQNSIISQNMYKSNVFAQLTLQVPSEIAVIHDKIELTIT